MSWTNAGSLAATNGNKNFVGTGTLMLGAFVDDALLYTNGTTVWMSDIASITDNTHMATVDNWPFSTGNVANGNWYIVPCSPLRQTTATLNNQLSTLIAGFAAIFSITASDNYGTLNKAASANNAGLYLTTAGSAVARFGTFGDDNLRMGPAAGGGGYTDAIVIDKTTALVSVYGDPTALLGIATKQYVDGASKTKVVRAAHNAGNITISSPGSTIGGVTPANGERYLLAAQTTGAQNGIYVYNGSSSAMTRVADAAAAAQLPSGCLIAVSEGTHANRVFILATAAPLVIGTTALTFTRLDTIELASPSLTGPTTVTSTSANAFAVGANGATNPALNVDASTASVATGLNIKGAAAAGGLALSVLSSATNEALTIDAKGSGTITLGGTSTGAISLARASAVTSNSANALAVGANGATTPALNVDASTASIATGLNIKGAAAAGGLALSVLSSGTNEALTIDAKGSGTITLGGTSTGAISLARASTVTSTSANAFAVGANGATNPALNVDASTASVATGLNIKGAAAAGGLALSVLSSGTNEALKLDAKGSGFITIGGTSSGNIIIGTGLTGSNAFCVGVSSPAFASCPTISNATIGQYGLVAQTTNAAGYGLFVYMPNQSAGGGNDMIECYDNALRMKVQGNGDVKNVNNVYGAISDEKYKEDIVTASSQWNDIKALSLIVSKYRLKGDTSGRRQLGLIAQQVLAISPGLISSTPDMELFDVQAKGANGEFLFEDDGTSPIMTKEQRATGTSSYSLNYSILYMKAVKALGEALIRIEALESKAA
jgi:hypothetical protein